MEVGAGPTAGALQLAAQELKEEITRDKKTLSQGQLRKRQRRLKKIYDSAREAEKRLADSKVCPRPRLAVQPSKAGVRSRGNGRQEGYTPLVL